MQVFGLQAGVYRGASWASRLTAKTSEIAGVRRDALRRFDQARRDGLSAVQAARAVGVSRASLNRWSHRLEPKSRRPLRTRPKNWTHPVPGGGVQMQILQFLGQGLGRIDFTPLPGTEANCDRTPPPTAVGPMRAMGPPPKCVPSGAMVDPNRVHGWIEPGGAGPREAGRAALWLNAQAFAPTRSNIRPVTVQFAESGRRTIDASDLIASNWYPSERWDFDAGFVGRYRTRKIDRDGVKLDVDKAAIAGVPVYVARQGFTQGVSGNPFPGVTDYTEVNKTGTWQTPEAKAVSPLDPAINAAFYFHTDFVGADDSRAGQERPGEPGVSAVSGTVVDWVLKRAKGLSDTPSPASLGVRPRY